MRCSGRSGTLRWPACSTHTRRGSLDDADVDSRDDPALVEDVEQLRGLVLRDLRDARHPRALAVGEVDEPDQTRGPSGGVRPGMTLPCGQVLGLPS